MSSRTIVFIHGLYMTPLCWEAWIPRFESKGYSCLAPAYPGRDKSVQELQAPDTALGRLSLSHIVDYLADKIGTMDERPILIGHSMGALIVQLLLNRGLASAAIAIDSAPPTGVFTTKFSFIKANWPHITPFANQSSPVFMTFQRFQYAFVNDFSLVEQRAAFNKYVVPESRRIPRESLFNARLDFRKEHAPLLLIAGGNDHIIPPGLNKANYRRYKDGSSITNFREFPGRTHFGIGQENWEEMADYCLAWLAEQKLEP